ASAETPIREELFSVERLEQYAATLASEHQLAERVRRVNLLLPRLEENSRKLIAAYKDLADSIRQEHVISPAAEWLVDNFHIVEEQVREIREDLPRGYYRELPTLAAAALRDYPRIYALSIPLVAHSDSHLDTETLRRFINAYQKVSPLSIGELWAVPISLRIALVENLRRLTSRIVSSRIEREDADRLADKLLELIRRQPDEVLPLLNSRYSKRKSISQTFAVQLTQRLREQDPGLMIVFEWLEKQLAKEQLSIEQIVRDEHRRQAAAQVTVGNIITSMRLLSTLDWKDFFETVSLIDPELSKDPAGIYSRMDFATRDRYRHVIERVSKRTGTTELEIARKAVELAERTADADRDPAHGHVGYFLIDDGLPQLEGEVFCRLSIAEILRRTIQRRATGFCLGGLTFLTGLVTAVVVMTVVANGAGVAMAVLTALLVLIPASELAISVLNWDVTHLFPPRLLPKIDLSHGI